MRKPRTVERRCYTKAKERCENPNHIGWKYYGGRGIEFRFNSFAQFLACLGPRPDGCVIDRINNDGHYEPGNVRWADTRTSALNRRGRPAKSGFRGVYSHGKRWQATIKINGKREHLGIFDTPNEASEVFERMRQATE